MNPSSAPRGCELFMTQNLGPGHLELIEAKYKILSSLEIEY